MLAPEPLSRKESLWLDCREKRCCSFYSVTLMGVDVWRIAKAMQLPAWVFTIYTEAPADKDYGFALDTSTKRYQIILAKRRVDEQSLQPCVFLWRLPDGHAQCGLGSLRPTVCQTYPSVMHGGIHCIGEANGCSCRMWALAHMDTEEEMQKLRTLERERAEYAEVVERWNERVQQAQDSQQRSYLEFCDYLMNVYAERYSGVETGG
jgi:Fe-S-cluster containining protein